MDYKKTVLSLTGSVTNAYLLYCKYIKKVKHTRFDQHVRPYHWSDHLHHCKGWNPETNSAWTFQFRDCQYTSPGVQCFKALACSHSTNSSKDESKKGLCCLQIHACRLTGKRWVKGELRKRVETKCMCGGCDGSLALSISPCFEAHHTVRDYWTGYRWLYLDVHRLIQYFLVYLSTK